MAVAKKATAAAAKKKPPAKAARGKQKGAALHVEPPPAYDATGKVQIEADVRLERLHVDPANARQHGERNMQAIVASLREHGQVEPLVVQRSSCRIIGGNGRYEAMRMLGWVSCMVAWVDIEDLAATKLGITLNRSAELAEWNLDTLDTLLADLEAHDVDLIDLGFSADDLDSLLGPAEEVDSEGKDDDVPEVPLKATTEPGDIWLLGPHRVMCGDSTDAAQVQALIAGTQVGCIITDPPYGMGLDTNFDGSFSRDESHRKVGPRHAPVHGDDKPYDPAHIFAMFPDVAEVVLWGGDYYRKLLPDGGSWYVWDKRCGEAMDKVTGNVFELAWSRAKHKREICRLLWSGHHGMQSDGTGKRVHPTQKPVALLTWLLERIEGEVVLDLFAGSGSTLMAADKAGRTALCMEIVPGYVDVIVRRWESATGQKAKRQG